VTPRATTAYMLPFAIPDTIKCKSTGKAAPRP
jgi:hypothetical protein